MIDKDALITGLTGSAISFSGIAIADIDHIVNIVTGALGFIVTLIGVIIIPMIKWYKEAKKDGKITVDEVEQGAEILKDGLNTIKDQVDDTTKIDKK